MSEKKAKEVRKENETINFTYRIDVCIATVNESVGSLELTTYMIVSGVPKDLPEEMMDTVKYAAQAQFATAINERKFIEFYDKGKTSKDSTPTFFNLGNIEHLTVLGIEQVNN